MDVIDFSEYRERIENDPIILSHERTYITQTTEFVVQTAEELGVAPPFIAILGKHVQDLRIIITPQPGDKSRAALTVYKDETEPVLTYKRAAVINPRHVEMYASCLKSALSAINCNLTDVDDSVFSNVALDWIMYELSADALGNSCYMQHNYDGYIKDFNGQSTSYNSHDTVAREFLKEYAGDFKETDVYREHESFRSGFAMQLLRNDLIRSRLCSSLKQAEWVITEISKHYPALGVGRVIEPMPLEALMSRCLNLKTKPSRARMAEFLLSFDDE